MTAMSSADVQELGDFGAALFSSRLDLAANALLPENDSPREWCVQGKSDNWNCIESSHVILLEVPVASTEMLSYTYLLGSNSQLNY